MGGPYGGEIGLPVSSVRGKVTASFPAKKKIAYRRIFLDGETEMCGVPFPIAKDRAPGNAFLVGMEVADSEGHFSATPIYRTSQGEVRGEPRGRRVDSTAVLEAKDGYVVGGLVASAGFKIEGFCLMYMKAKSDGSLDVDDSYFSEWIGKRREDHIFVGGTGAPAVGMLACAAEDRKLAGIGLILQPLRPGEKTPAPASAQGKRNRGRSARVPTAAEGIQLPSPEVHANEERSNPTRSPDGFELKPIFPDGETEIAGAPDNVVRDRPAEMGLLVGFQIGTLPDDPRVQSMTPIFRTSAGEVRGKQHGLGGDRKLIVRARDGYAIGGLVVRGDDEELDGCYVVFMEVKADGFLDLKETYSSEWIGAYSGGQPTLLGATGAPVIGFLASGPPNEPLGGVGLILRKR